ncbi:MAG: DUF1963 domain-containing protein [Janthinobacterium lividum]
MTPLPPLPTGLQPYAAAIDAHLHQPTAWFVPINKLASSPAQSKIGGYPYLPLNAPNPLVDTDGQHRYNLLMQLNLADLPAPRPPHFPAQGLLQFFAGDFSAVMDDEPSPMHCVYHPTIATDAAALVTDFSAYPITSLEGYEDVPAEGGAVSFKSLTYNRVEPGDFYGDLGYLFTDVADADERAQLQAALTDYFEAYNEAVPETEPEWTEEVQAQYPVGEYDQPLFQSPLSYSGFSIPDHQLGGFISQFWQGDPRPPGDEDSSQPHYNQLLLAYDARGNCTEYAVPFLGQDAKLLLYINRDELARGNFSDLLYSWMP